MIDDLLPYYNRELAFIRQMAGEFAQKYPGVAARLQLEPNDCGDPHVERLIESFALLAGRVHRKLDDEFPEITEALLDILYPHYLRPVPSMMIVQFHRDPSQSAVTTAVEAPAGTQLRATAPDGEVCSFRTCYPVKLWPLRVVDASVSPPGRFAGAGLPQESAAVIRIELECPGDLRFGSLPLDTLRFYLHGESHVVNDLYEALFLNSLRVTLRGLPGGTGSPTATLAANAIRPVGFTGSEGMLPYGDRSFAGYRLLQEYFAFPEKFLFFDLTGLGRIARGAFGSRFEILVALKQFDEKHRLVKLEQSVDAATFQLGCAPAVNLFDRIAEPVRISHTVSEYRVIPDQHRPLSTEVYSINRVMSTASYMECR